MYINLQTYELSSNKKTGTFFVDDDIAKTIQVLNQKGYKTSACCSGHNERPLDHAYIQYDFAEITPETLPGGWYWCDNYQQMEYEYQSGVGEERLQEIQTVMHDLESWALSLLDTNL